MKQLSVDEWLFRPDSDLNHPVVYEREYEYLPGSTKAIRLNEVGTEAGVDARIDMMELAKVTNTKSDGYKDIHQLFYDIELIERERLSAFSTLLNGQFIFTRNGTDFVIKMQSGDEVPYKYTIRYGDDPVIHIYLRDVIDAPHTEISKYLCGSYYFTGNYLVYIDYIDEGNGSVIDTKRGNEIFSFQMKGRCDFDGYRTFLHVSNETYGKTIIYQHNDHMVTTGTKVCNKGINGWVQTKESAPYYVMEDTESGEVSSMYPVPFVFTPYGIKVSDLEHPLYINEYWHPDNFVYERNILELETDEVRKLFYNKTLLKENDTIIVDYKDLLGH